MSTTAIVAANVVVFGFSRAGFREMDFQVLHAPGVDVAVAGAVPEVLGSIALGTDIFGAVAPSSQLMIIWPSCLMRLIVCIDVDKNK